MWTSCANQGRGGDTKTLLLYNNAALRNIFCHMNNIAKCLPKHIFNHVAQQKAPMVLWVDKYCTSKVDINN